MRFRTVLLSLLFVATFSSYAQADRWKVERFNADRIRVNIMTGVGWYNDVGVGFRLEIPILANLVKGVPNDLRASVGGELRWFYHPKYDGFGGYPVAVGQWNFYVTDRWSFFPELGFCGVFAPERKRFWGSFIAPFAGGGARYTFNRHGTAVVFRLNWPAGIQLGVSF